MSAVLTERNPHAANVDRANGIIRRVKVLGFSSKKGRTYPPAVVAKALPLYENIPVNVDHVDPGQRRSYRDRIGRLKNVSLESDGMYGDFHVNRSHPLADQVLDDAENSPQNLGFSHDTRGASSNRNGKTVVDSIDKVLSVDLVANPATTDSLFESYDGQEDFSPLPPEIRRQRRQSREEAETIRLARLARTVERFTRPTSLEEVLSGETELTEDTTDPPTFRPSTPDPWWVQQTIERYTEPDRHRRPAVEFKPEALTEDILGIDQPEHDIPPADASLFQRLRRFTM